MFELTTTSTFTDHVQIEELEKKYLPHDSVASASLTWQWSQANPESLFILRDKAKPHVIAGHLSAFPVRKEESHLLMTGQLRDTDLSASAILPYAPGICADLYFAVICVDEVYRPGGAFCLVSFFTRFIKDKMRLISIDNILAEAGTRDGQRLLERRGFHKYRAEDDIPCFYHGSLSKIARRF